MLGRRPTKRVTHRLLGDAGYAELQSRYWRSRLRRLRYPYEFRTEIAAAVSPGDTVVDVGANVGQYAALLARMVGPEGRVLAFEPVPRTFRILASVVAGLELSNVETLQLALADSDGTARFAEVQDVDGLPDSGLAHLATGADRSTVEVPVARLDSLCAGSLAIAGCTFLKIDVEGAELLVLRGASAFLETRRPLILVEVDRGMQARYDCSPEETIAFLEGLGYVCPPDGRRSPNFLFRPSPGGGEASPRTESSNPPT
jgi:FkbM family methyltransferase